MAKSNSSVTTLDDADTAVEAAVVAPVVVGTNHDEALSGARRTVVVHESNGDGGSDAVFVGLNGYAFQIPRGVPCSVPVEVIEILKSAKVRSISNTPGGAVVERDIPRYSFSVE